MLITHPQPESVSPAGKGESLSEDDSKNNETFDMGSLGVGDLPGSLAELAAVTLQKMQRSPTPQSPPQQTSPQQSQQTQQSQQQVCYMRDVMGIYRLSLDLFFYCFRFYCPHICVVLFVCVYATILRSLFRLCLCHTTSNNSNNRALVTQ